MQWEAIVSKQDLQCNLQKQCVDEVYVGCRICMWQPGCWLCFERSKDINTELKYCSKGKGKTVSVHAMKVYEEVELQLHSFFISALDEGQWLASHPNCFTPSKRALSSHVIGWVGLRAILDAFEKRKISCFSQEMN